MKRGQKRGLSTVITTLIIISLSLVTITILWVVIRNIINSGSQAIEIGSYTIDMEIQKVSQNLTDTNVTIKRNQGQGEINSVKTIISDGTNSYIYNSETDIKELETETIMINYSGIIDTVSISPTISSGTGEVSQGIIDAKPYTKGDTLVRNMPGLVSWWRFEGNAKDEMGRNNGNVIGTLPVVNGKFGKAYNFTDGNYINITDNPSLRLESSNMSAIVWIYVNDIITGNELAILLKGNATSILHSKGYGLTILPSVDPDTFEVDGNFFIKYYVNNRVITTTTKEQKKRFAHISTTTNFTTPTSSIRKIYLNGNIILTNSNSMAEAITIGKNLVIGYDYYQGSNYFNGIIDEVMIFNRTLSASEIQEIYNMDLSP